MDSTKPQLNATPTDWELMQRQSRAFIASQLLPKHVTYNSYTKAPYPPDIAMARAVTIIQCGKELGIPPLQSLRHIQIIDGKPTLASELLLALCYQKIPGFGLRIITDPKKQVTECLLEVWRRDILPQQFSFTIEDARRAGLIRSGSGWEKYPADMLQSRAISRACRRIAPDATMGIYTPEELEPVHEAKDTQPITNEIEAEIDPDPALSEFLRQTDSEIEHELNRKLENKRDEYAAANKRRTEIPELPKKIK